MIFSVKRLSAVHGIIIVRQSRVEEVVEVFAWVGNASFRVWKVSREARTSTFPSGLDYSILGAAKCGPRVAGAANPI